MTTQTPSALSASVRVGAAAGSRKMKPSSIRGSCAACSFKAVDARTLVIPERHAGALQALRRSPPSQSTSLFPRTTQQSAWQHRADAESDDATSPVRATLRRLVVPSIRGAAA